MAENTAEVHLIGTRESESAGWSQKDRDATRAMRITVDEESDRWRVEVLDPVRDGVRKRIADMSFRTADAARNARALAQKWRVTRGNVEFF